MGKIVWIFIGIIGVLFSNETVSLDEQCLKCHQLQQIPNTLIYRRYLKQYSTDERMELAMTKYLKNPQKIYSIMPPQFFLKFPMKETAILDDETLPILIKAYLSRFDIKKQLVLER